MDNVSDTFDYTMKTIVLITSMEQSISRRSYIFIDKFLN